MLAKPFIDYVDFVGDEDFLRTRASVAAPGAAWFAAVSGPGQPTLGFGIFAGTRL
jgi:hypothetical protein